MTSSMKALEKRREADVLFHMVPVDIGKAVSRRGKCDDAVALEQALVVL